MNNGFLNPDISFGKRLEFLMEEDGIVIKRGASAELSKRLYKRGILKYNNIDYDAQNKERDNVRNRIDEHRKTDSAENISGHWLKIYCDYFHCSADYLFGYIELPTHEKTNIKNHTGLSKNAIDKLINLYNTANNNEDVFGSYDALECLDIISNLLTSKDFLAILKEINNADGYEIAVHEANAGSIEEKKKNISNIHHWVGMLARCKYEILIRFSKMIDARYNAGKKLKHYENDFQITKRDRDISPI